MRRFRYPCLIVMLAAAFPAVPGSAKAGLICGFDATAFNALVRQREANVAKGAREQNCSLPFTSMIQDMLEYRRQLSRGCKPNAPANARQSRGTIAYVNANISDLKSDARFCEKLAQRGRWSPAGRAATAAAGVAAGTAGAGALAAAAAVPYPLKAGVAQALRPTSTQTQQQENDDIDAAAEEDYRRNWRKYRRQSR